MGFRGIFFIGFFLVCCVLSLFEPLAGIVAYLTHYHVYPEQSWWGAGLAGAGFRYSFTIVLCLVLGTALNWRKLKYRRLITGQEGLYLGFLGWLLLCRILNGVAIQTVESSTDTTEKMVKMAVFLLILTHVVVTEVKFQRVCTTLILCALYVGYEAFTAPPSAFYKGRLNGYVGGPDFVNSNALAAHCLALLVIIGVQFLHSGWKGKALCFVAGALTADTIAMTQSRAAFMAALAGVVVALCLAPKGKRGWIWLLVLCGGIGAWSLVDSHFMDRLETIEVSTDKVHEASAQERLDAWKGTLQMFIANPLGVGPGNHLSRIHEYAVGDGERDTHNTYLKCAAELGWPGLILLCLIIGNAFLTLHRIRKRINLLQEQDTKCIYYWFTLVTALPVYLMAAFFGSYTYLEMFWILLLLPSSLERVVENRIEDFSRAEEGPTPWVAGPLPGRHLHHAHEPT